MKSVTIVIPAKNEQRYLDMVLSYLSCAVKSYDGYVQVILVDNGSSDDTVKIALMHGCQIVTEHYGTIAKLRNIGAGLSKSELIGFLDADCLVDKNWIAYCADRLTDNRIGLVGTRAIPDLLNATWVEKGWYMLISGVPRPDFPRWIGSSNMFLRRTDFMQVGGFDEGLVTAEDVNLCNKINKVKKVYLENRINTIHLRESKTMAQLFLRELTRGKSSLRQMKRSLQRLENVNSIAIVAVNIVTLISILMSLVVTNMTVKIIGISHIALPLVMMFKKRATCRSINDIVITFMVAYIYIQARTIAMLFEIKEIGCKRDRFTN